MTFRVFKCGRLPLVVISFFVLGGLSCAKQGIPPGDKEEREPPKLMSSLPENMTVDVSTDTRIVFKFSDSMNEESVEDNFFIIPVPSAWPEFSWSSRNTVLTVDPIEPLRRSTTYIFSIGTKAKGVKGTLLEDTITVTFSTGDSIENGKITGRLIPYGFFDTAPENVSGVDVVAYLLDNEQSMPDPRNDVPDYFTQSSSDGSYEIIGLSQAVYRIFAIGDKDGDGFYSEGSDMIGIAPHDIEVARNDSVSAFPIMISERDTSHVQFRSMRAQDSGRVELFFDREIIYRGSTLAIDGLDIIGWFVDRKNSKMISAATAVQEKDKRYSVAALEVFDRDGNTNAPLNKMPAFKGTDTPDTTALSLIDWGPEILVPGNDPIYLVFNRVLALSDTPGDTFALADGSGEDLVIIRTNPNELEITASEGWKESIRYEVSLDIDMIRGAAGNILADSENSITFRVAPADTLGLIRGSIEDTNVTGNAEYRILLKHLDTDSIKEVTVKDSLNWSAGGVLPGRYVALAYRDNDGNGELFRGTVKPYKPAEAVAIYPDTVTVESRWPSDGIDFGFK